ncbi:putative nuclease HARBI1 isoform X1 [Drosophila virilis]|uniref:Uncharacterized protein, isoform B n=1 Tax=Drosophila virilis TaxID=7244 RepID=A0A0Q9WKB4_DROVI|nr:protein ALP1-like isoform X1 [Drosophila virilis]KRF85193.1 uncharacterized protein Dvir_GJ14048, isoform B [Drosophila virilis]
MDPAKLLMLCEQNEYNLLNLLDWEEEFEQTVEEFRLTLGRRRKKRKAPREWKFQRTGAFWESEVPASSEEHFINLFRMEKQYFHVLVKRLLGIKKSDTSFRKAIPIDKRIAIALYTLGSTAEYSTVGDLFSVSPSMVGKILNDFCQEVQRVLAPEYLPKEFLTQSQLEECVRGFEARGLPQCFGALGSCLIEVNNVPGNIAEYYNTQDWYSRILFALVDHRCRFLYVNYKSPGGRQNDEVYEESSLKSIVNASTLFKSNSKLIAGVKVPVMLLGDSAFQCSTVLLTPYANPQGEQQKLFNNQLDECRRVVDKALRQLKARFCRIFECLDNHSKPFDIILCCCILHNYLNCNKSRILESWLNEPRTERIQPVAIGDARQQTDVEAEHIRQGIGQFLSTINISKHLL